MYLLYQKCSCHHYRQQERHVGRNLILIKNSRQQQSNYFRILHKIEKVLVPLIKKYKQVEMGFECSALLSQYISDVINGAHRAVLFPLQPLYDISQKTITPQFEKALDRIFRICDKDNDYKWSDDELRDFQLDVFSGELSSSDIQGIKQLIREEEIINQDRSSSLNNNEINFEGLKILQKKCVELMKMQICWAILRHFNYDDKLELDKKLFKDQYVDQFYIFVFKEILILYKFHRLIVNTQAGQTVELSGRASQFLINQCFKRFGTEKKIISSKDNEEIIETVLLIKNISTIFFPYSNDSQQVNNEDNHPFTHLLKNVTSSKEYLLLEEWLCLWAYKTRQDYLEVYKMLVYIGYQGSLEETFLITNSTNCLRQIQKMYQRYVYNVCLVSLECKDELVRMLQRYQRKVEKSLATYQDFVTQVKLENGKKKIIIYTFVNSYDIGEVLFDVKDESEIDEKNYIRKFDQIAILFKDQGELLKFVNEESERCEKFIECPKFFIQISNQKDLELDPELRAYSRQYICCNSIDDVNDFTLLKGISNLIEKPTKGLQKEYIQKIQEQDNFFRKNMSQILIGGGILGVLGIVFWINKSSIKHIFTQIKKNLGL